MKLSHQQIEKISRGVAYVSTENDRTVLHRFTREQKDLYKTVSEDFYNKCFATSGISLRFDTDSTYIYFKVFVKQRSSRKFLSHTVFADGKLIGKLNAQLENAPNTLSTAYLEGSFKLGDGSASRRISIFLPWSFSSEICELSLDDGASITPAPASIKMICFGDSITQGYDAEDAQNPYATELATKLDADARNKGIGGEKFRPSLAKLADDEFDPDIITVAYGTNDWSGEVSKSTFDENCSRFYGELARKYPTAKIFSIAPIWRADNDRITNVGEFKYVREFLEKTAAMYDNVTVIDAFSFVPENTKLFSDKFLHPNDAGFECYAKNLIKEIKKYL